MKRGRSIFFSFLLVTVLHADLSADKQLLVEEKAFLDCEIAQLEEDRDYYRAKIARLRNSADRLQFQGDILDAKLQWNAADKYAALADSIEKELTKLERDRHAIIEQISENS